MDSAEGRLAARIAAMSSRAVGLENAVMGSPTEVIGEGGALVEVPIAGHLWLEAGDPVLVARAGTFAWVVASLRRRPTSGPVTAVGAGTVVVTLDGSSMTLPALASYASPTVGDVVEVLWQGSRGVVLGRSVPVSAPPPAPIAGDTGAPSLSPVQGSTVIVRPIDTQTWRGGKWRTDTTDIVQGNSSWGINHGFFFYGSALDSVPPGWTKLTVWLHATADFSSPRTLRFRLHGARTRGASKPATSSTWAGPMWAPGQVGEVDITAGAAGIADTPGLALVSDSSLDYLRLHGIERSPDVGRLTFTY